MPVHGLPLFCGCGGGGTTVKYPHLGVLRNVAGAEEAGTPELHPAVSRRVKVTHRAVVSRSTRVGRPGRRRRVCGLVDISQDQNEMQVKDTSYWLKCMSSVGRSGSRLYYQLLGGIHLCEFEDRLYSELQDSLRYIVRSCLIKIITNNKILKNGFTKQPQRKYFSSVFKKKKKTNTDTRPLKNKT